MTAQHHFSDQQQTSMRMAAFHHRTPMASWHVIVGRMIGLAILAVLTVVFWWLFSVLASLAFAELYVAGDMLHNEFSCPKVDGTWKQDLITGGSNCDTGSIAWDTGLGYRFDGGDSSWTKLWSVEAGYRNWGNVGVGGRWVSDEHYTEVMQHGEGWLADNGITPTSHAFEDRLEGAYLRFAKGFETGLGLEPYVSAGIFVARHKLSRAGKDTGYSGIVAGPTVGCGVKYDLYHGLKFRVSADYHRAFTEAGHPPSTEFITVGGGVEVPLKKFW